jgi:hypothetical protein
MTNGPIAPDPGPEPPDELDGSGNVQAPDHSRPESEAMAEVDDSIAGGRAQESPESKALQANPEPDAGDPIDDAVGVAANETVRWRFAYATAQGPSHIKHDVVCQDATSAQTVSLNSGQEYIVLAVADGAGTAAFADRGAALACSLVVGELADRIAGDGSLAALDLERAREIVTWCAGRIGTIAHEEGASPRDFASTLLVAALGPDECAFLQVGDGVIVIRGVEAVDAEYKEVFWPDRGEYANETLFVTDPRGAERVRFDRWEGRIAEVALVTDGLQPLVLNYADRVVHPPFFAKTFALLASERPGFQETLSERLAEALASPAFAERNDDDKAIAVASRTETISS